jgi:hypothetical protein
MATEYYQWRDSQGVLINSDQPPPEGVEYEVLSTLPAFGPARGAEAEASEDRPADDNLSAVSPEEALQANKNPELCQRARQDLQILTESEQVKMRDSQGEERLMTPEEIIVERQKAMAEVSVYCE